MKIIIRWANSASWAALAMWTNRRMARNAQFVRPPARSAPIMPGASP